jgi:hypothetical protein
MSATKSAADLRDELNLASVSGFGRVRSLNGLCDKHTDPTIMVFLLTFRVIWW